ncbi:MAG: peroxiredoxin family protein [Pseudomonadales bacterium]
MQLGELQNQIDRFQRRNITIIAISVDNPDDSVAMIRRLGLSFDLASDPGQTIVKVFGVQNPDTQELALHAVYIVDEQGRIFYRKVARRRPVSAELIDAIDAHRGLYPQSDRIAPAKRIAVAYPQNNFQALIEISQVEQLPGMIDPQGLAEVQVLIEARESDNALFAFKRLIQASSGASPEDLYDTAAWLVRQSYFPGNITAMEAGVDLRRRLRRVSELEEAEQAALGSSDRDELLHTLAAARAGLTRVRADISNHADEWNLRYAKSSLRSYREVVRAATLEVD